MKQLRRLQLHTCTAAAQLADELDKSLATHTTNPPTRTHGVADDAYRVKDECDGRDRDGIRPIGSAYQALPLPNPFLTGNGSFPLRTATRARVGSQLQHALMKFAALHDGVDHRAIFCKNVEVVERITVHQQDVGERAFPDYAQFIFCADDFSVHRRSL